MKNLSDNIDDYTFKLQNKTMVTLSKGNVKLNLISQLLEQIKRVVTINYKVIYYPRKR